MPDRIKFISPGNIIAILIPGVYCSAALNNPGFEDPLWPVIAYGSLIALAGFISGCGLILLRLFNVGKKERSVYFAIGLLNVGYGIAGIVLLFLTFVPAILFYIIPVLICGIYICIDAHASQNK